MPQTATAIIRQLVYSTGHPDRPRANHVHALVNDSGEPDPVVPGALGSPIEGCRGYVDLSASRYCETELLMPVAWGLFAIHRRGKARTGDQRLCAQTHHWLSACATSKTAYEAYREAMACAAIMRTCLRCAAA